MPEAGFQLVLDAVSFACRAHRGQMRKDGETPYAAHPMRVLLTMQAEFGVEDPEVLAAAALHDTIEDTTVDRDELAEHFGDRVATMVAALTKDMRLPEEERERDYIAQLVRAPFEVRLVKLADTLDNLRDASGLPPAARQKGIAKARRVLEAFAGSLPERWAGAVETVRAEVEVSAHAEPMPPG